MEELPELKTSICIFIFSHTVLSLADKTEYDYQEYKYHAHRHDQGYEIFFYSVVSPSVAENNGPVIRSANLQRAPLEQGALLENPRPVWQR